MDIGLIFLTLTLLVLVGLFVSRPLFERGKQVGPAGSTGQVDHDLSALLAERDRILNALQELDFDYTLGKIPEEDYPFQRADLLQRGAAVLRRLDEMQAQAPADDAEARIEAVIAARRADAQAAPATPVFIPGNGRQKNSAALQVAAPDDEIEAVLANRRRLRKEKAAGFCPQCGDPVQKSDRFCPNCGKTLAQ